jgi:hypothetical protein
VFGPVSSLPPSVKNVIVRQNEAGRIEVIGHYTGGREGRSLIELRAANPGGSAVSLGTSTEREFVPPPDLAGRTVEASYLPVREDGARGRVVASANRVIVQPLPVVDSAELLSQTGHFTLGSTLRCRAKVSNGHGVYQWYTKASMGSKLVKKPDATDRDYVVTSEDVGLLLVCSVDPVNALGWRGKTVAATACERVSEAPMNLVIVSHKNRFQTGVEITTNGGQPVAWEMDNGGEWVNVAERQVSYLLTTNEIGHRVRACSEEQNSAPTPLIVLRPQLMSFVRASVRARTFKFTGIGRLRKMRWSVIVDESGIVMKGKMGDKVGKWATISFSAVPGQPGELVLWLDPSCKYLISPEFPNDQRLTTALGTHVRDFVCATLSEYAKAAAGK